MDLIVGFATTCRHESGSRASGPGIGLRAVRIYWQRRGRLRASDCGREHLIPDPKPPLLPRVHDADARGSCARDRSVVAGDQWLARFGRAGRRRCPPPPRARQIGDRIVNVHRTRSRRGRPSEYAVHLGGHDEVVLMQSLDLLGLQRDRRVAPIEADVRMMAFSFRQFTNLLNKGKRLPEIAKAEAPLDEVSFQSGACA
jgi:hypothetical protein